MTHEKTIPPPPYGHWWCINTDRSHLPAVPPDAFNAYGWGEPKRATLRLIIPSVDVVAVLSMERLSDDKKWDVIQNARGKTNDGPRSWVGLLCANHCRSSSRRMQPAGRAGLHAGGIEGARDVRRAVRRRDHRRFELVARGRVVSLTINGYLAWSVTDPAPRSGFIAVRGDADGFELTNITLRWLDPKD